VEHVVGPMLSRDDARNLLNASDEGYAMIDATGVYVWANDAAYRLLRTSPARLLGSSSILFAHAVEGEERTCRIDSTGATLARTFSVGVFRLPSRGMAPWGMRFRDVTETVDQGARLDAFMRSTSAVALGTDLNGALDLLAEEVRAVTGFATCTIFVSAPPPLEYQALGKAGYPDDWADRVGAAIDRGAQPFTLEAERRKQPVVFRNFRARFLEDPRWESVWGFVRDLPWNTYVAVPMMVRGESIGAMAGFLQVDRDPTPDDLRFISAMADHAAAAIDSSRLLSSARLLAIERERTRVAQDLHDSVAQTLYSLALRIQTVRALGLRDGVTEQLMQEISEAERLVQSSSTQVRDLLSRIHRPEPFELGLMPAVRLKADEISLEAGLPIDVRCEVDVIDLAPDRAEDVYRIVAEAMTNARKHAAASRVVVQVDVHGDHLTVSVTDDGGGIGPTHERLGIGLPSMRERAERLGARLDVATPSAGGTRIELTVPLESIDVK
jgi:signal transduction histidine kinase